MRKTVFLKVTSAVAIAGKIEPRDSIVKVDEDLAINLLQRGKVEVATGDDVPASEPDGEPAEGEGEGAPSEPKPDDKPAKEPKPEKPAK